MTRQQSGNQDAGRHDVLRRIGAGAAVAAAVGFVGVGLVGTANADPAPADSGSAVVTAPTDATTDSTIPTSTAPTSTPPTGTTTTPGSPGSPASTPPSTSGGSSSSGTPTGTCSFLTAKNSSISITVGGGLVTATVTPHAGVDLCPTKVFLRQFEVPATWDGNGYDASAQPQTLLPPVAQTTISGSATASLSVALNTTAGLYTTDDGCATAVNRQFDVATGTTHLAGGPRRIPVGTVPNCHTTPPTSPSGGGNGTPTVPPSGGGGATPTVPEAGSATVATPGSFAAGDSASHSSSLWTWLLGGSAAALAGAGAIAFRRPRSARH